MPYGAFAILVVAILVVAILGLLLLVALAILGIGQFRSSSRLSTNTPSLKNLGDGGDAVALEESFAFVFAMNSSDAIVRGDVAVRLRGAVRLVPTDLSSAAREVATHFVARQVVSIDLARMKSLEAARLVDFCGGLASAGPGWLFRAADRVVVLSPSR